MINSSRRALLLMVVWTAASGSAEPIGRQTPRANNAIADALRTGGGLQSRIRFEHLTSDDGLSHDSVFAILQDRYDFLWIGTQAGLNRYDGHRVTQYRHDPRNAKSLAGDFVQFLFEDSHGGIWAGRSTLTRFDPTTETFRRFDIPVTRQIIVAVTEDNAGFIWVGLSFSRALLRLDPNTGQIRAYDLAAGLASDQFVYINALHKDATGQIWIGTTDGLLRFDPATGATERNPHARANPAILADRIRAISQDKSGMLWLAASEGSDNVFDLSRKLFLRRWGPPSREKLGQDINTSVFADEDGIVYLGTMGGLQVFDPATGGFSVLRHNPADRHSLNANEVNTIARDRDGNIWIGTKGGGVSRFSPSSLRFGAWRNDSADSNSPSDDNVRAIYHDRSGVIWIGTYNGGLNRLDPATGRFTRYRHNDKDPRTIDHDTVYSIYEDRRGELWVGTGKGINRLDRKTGTFTRFSRGTIGTRGTAIPTYSLMEDRNGTFWFGAGDFRAQLDRQTGVVSPESLDGGLSLHEDRNGNIWFGAIWGLSRLERSGKARPVTLARTPGSGKPAPVQINFMHEDSQGLIWLATETGLMRFDPVTEKTQKSYTTADGLPDNVVQCIAPDTTGNLWLSTNRGLSRFNPRDNTFVNYHESDGLQGEQFNRKSCYADPQGILYFGGLHGFNIFDPQKIQEPVRGSHRIVMTELRIHGRAVEVAPGSVLPRPIWQMDRLRLLPRDDSFSLEFATVDYRGPAEARYRFKLQGFENRWTEVNNRNRIARYTGLNPGDYEFRVEMSTDGRTWSEPGASLHITMEPPWWKTLWFQGGAVLLLAGLMTGGYKWRVRSLRLREKRLQQLVDQRTEELVIARDVAERANRVKGAFLANMSHELRTPLNAILGFSGLLRARAASEEQRRDLGIINRSGEHLLTLINDILDVARIEAGRMVLEPEACDLKLLVHDVTDMIGVRAQEKMLTLIVNEPPESCRFIRTDPARLRQVLLNLLTNAVKYTSQGSVTLRFGAQTVQDNRILLDFEVEDTGIGIAPEDQQRVFEPFEQVANTGRKGTGLGLAITRETLHVMGGTIALSSSPGKGSCFRVEVPVERAEPSGALAPVEGGRIIRIEDAQREYRVLVVEDDADSRTVLERILRDVGFVVRTAANGAEGVDVFRSWRPHFVWLDLRMPVMDGLEASRQMRALPGSDDVKIAALTVSDFQNQRDVVLAAGMNDYLSKPCRPDEVFDCMARHLGIRFVRAENTVATASSAGSELHGDAIRRLPPELRFELRTALTMLDAGRISQGIDAVGHHDPALAEALRKIAGRYAYSVILRAFTESVPPSAVRSA